MTIAVDVGRKATEQTKSNGHLQTFHNVLTLILSILSHDVASGCDIMPCNKIDKSLVVYRFNNVM